MRMRTPRLRIDQADERAEDAGDAGNVCHHEQRWSGGSQAINERKPRSLKGMRVHFESYSRCVGKEHVKDTDGQGACNQCTWNVASRVFCLFCEGGRVLPANEQVYGEREACAQARETTGQV